jgi:hypothetical protein
VIETLRHWSTTWAAKAVFGLMICSMGLFWGLSDVFRRQHPLEVVVTVNGQEIQTRALRAEVERRLVEQEALTGRPVTQDMIKDPGVVQAVLYDMIFETILDMQADELGLVVSQKALHAHIRALNVFHDHKGVFSRERFQRFLSRNGLHEQSFLAQQRRALKRAQLLGALTAVTQFPESSQLVIGQALAQKRVAASVYLEDVAVPKPSDAALQAYFQEHQHDFEEPEARTFECLVIQAKDVKEGSSFYELIQQVDDALAGGLSLEEVATTCRVAYLKIPADDRAQQVGPEGLGSALTQDLAQKAHQHLSMLAQEASPQVHRLAPEVCLVGRVLDVRAAYVPDFDAVRDPVKKAWYAAEKRTLLQKRAENLAQQVRAGSKAALKQLGTQEPVGLQDMRSPASHVPPEVQAILWQLEEGGVAVVPAQTGAGVYVVLLKQILSDGRAVVPENIKSGFSNDVITAYVRMLRNRSDVHINRDALAMLTASSDV